MTTVELGMPTPPTPPALPAPRRRASRQVMVGVPVGGDAPITVQSMTTTRTVDIDAMLQQIAELTAAGCHKFDDKIKKIAHAATTAGVQIRIGVNVGSLDKRFLVKYGRATPEALVESALWEFSLFEEHGFTDIKISVKHHDPMVMVAAYRQLAAQWDCPLHLGVTEAGPHLQGTIKSAIAFGVLLTEGIGDTIRVSLSTPGRGSQSRPPNPAIPRPKTPTPGDRVLPLLRTRASRRLHPHRPSRRRLRRLPPPAARRRYGLCGQWPRRSRPRRLRRQRQRPNLRAGRSRPDRLRITNR
jgi:hypothetical protein